MGLDLKLLPFEGVASVPYSHSILACDRDSRLFAPIEELMDSANIAPAEFSCFLSRIPEGPMKGERCYGIVTETPYGDRLKSLSAGTLAAIPLPKDSSLRNRAVWVYLALLPPDTQVAIYWC